MKKILFAIISVIVGAAAFAASSLVSDTAKNSSGNLFGRAGSIKAAQSAKGTQVVQNDFNTDKARFGAVLPLPSLLKMKSFSGKLVSSKLKQEDIQKIPGKDGENGNMVQILWDSKTGELMYVLVDEKGTQKSEKYPLVNRNDFNFGSIQDYNVNIPKIVCDEKSGMYKSVLGDDSMLIQGSRCVAADELNGSAGEDGRVPELKCDPEISDNFIYNVNGVWYEIEDSRCVGDNGQNATLPVFYCTKDDEHSGSPLMYRIGNGEWRTVYGSTLCGTDSRDINEGFSISCVDGVLSVDGGKTKTTILCQKSASSVCGFYGDGKVNEHRECLEKYVASGTSEYIFECRDKQFINVANNDLIFTGADCDKIYCDNGVWFFADLNQSTGIPCKNVDSNVRYYDCNTKEGVLIDFPGVKCGENHKVFCDVDGWVYVDNGKSKKNTNVQCNVFGKIYCSWDTGKIFNNNGNTDISCKYARSLSCKDEKILMYGDIEFPLDGVPCNSVVCKDGFVMFENLNTGIPCSNSNDGNVVVDKEYTCDKDVLTVGDGKIACGDKMHVICAKDGMVYYAETKDGPWNPTGVSCGALKRSDMYCLWDKNSVVMKSYGSTGAPCDKANILCKDGEITIDGYNGKLSVADCDKDLVCDKKTGLWSLYGDITGVRCDKK